VTENENIVVEGIEGKEGEKIQFLNVNLFSDGQKIEIGQPVLEKIVVEATIKKQFKGDKVIAFKYKPKKRYRRKVGYRKPLTLLHLDKIQVK
jgi:large subunit ribosomal protein L21